MGNLLNPFISFVSGLVTFPITFAEADMENKWISTDVEMAVDTINDLLDLIFKRELGANARAIIFDLQDALGAGVNASDTLWGLRFKLKLLSKNGNIELWGGLSDSDQDVGQLENQDWIGWEWDNVTLNTYYAIDSDGAAIPNTGADSQASTLAVNDIVYIEILRTSATAYTVEIFDNADFSTGSRGKITATVASTTDTLRFIKFLARDSAPDSAEATTEVDDVNFVNNTNTF